MGFIDKAASILTLGGVRHRSRRESKAKAAQARLAEVDAKVAQEQAAAIAKALHEDEAHRKADLDELAEKEAEALPWHPPTDS